VRPGYSLLVMPSRRLDILALEPFYGGERRQTLKTLSQFSRHHWTVLKLPPRRVERRLAAASRWFGEVISRGDLDRHCDLLFVGEMMNLPDLQRIVPRLGRRPSVVYFHDNQMPGPAPTRPTSPLDVVNLNTAMAATAVWFNSRWHRESFLSKTSHLIAGVPEIRGQNPVPALLSKSKVVLPPVKFERAGRGVKSDPRTLLVDLGGGADVKLLADVLDQLIAGGERFQVFTIGTSTGLSGKLPRTALRDDDEAGQRRALQRAGLFLSVRTGAASDALLASALGQGCWPVVPDAGTYPELLPPPMHPYCLHDGSAGSVVDQILSAWYGQHPADCDADVSATLKEREAVKACRAIDKMLLELAERRSLHS
jgi:hypothetical protein